MSYFDDNKCALNPAGLSTPSKKRVSRSEFETPTNRRFSEPQSSNSHTQSADDIEDQVLIEGRGQMRIDVPRDEFHKSFLSRLKQDVEPLESHTGYYSITESQLWGEEIFYQNVLKSSMEDMCAASIPFFHASYCPC